jgi:hypothetical protein
MSSREPPTASRKVSEASAALERLEREAREAAAEAQHRHELQQREAAEEAARKRERQEAHDADDSLSVGDFYRMSCTGLSHPSALLWVSIFGGLGLTLASSALLAQRNWGATVQLEHIPPSIALVLLLLGGPPLLRALRLRQAYRRLPFTLSGLGRLLRRTGHGGWTEFAQCSLRLVPHGEDHLGLPVPKAREARLVALQLATGRLNTALARIAAHPSDFEALRWTHTEDAATGFSNARLAGQLLAFCQESLVPLQRAAPFLQAVHIEPSGETYSISVGD